MESTSRLSDRVGAAIGWNVAASLIRLATQAVAMVALARLIDATAFGIFCQGLLVVGVVNLLAHNGVAAAVVQRAQIMPQQVEAATLVCLLLGVLLTAALWVSAPTLAWLFRSEDSVGVFRAMSSLVLLNGVAAIALALEKRSLDFRRLFVIDAASYAAGYSVVGITLGWLGCGVWALVFAAIVHEGSRAFIAHRVTGLRYASANGIGSLRDFRRFSLTTSLTGAMLFAAKNLDALIVSRVLGVDALGIHNRAFQLAKMPISLVSRVTNSVLFSAFSRLQENAGRFRQAYYQSLEVLALFVFPASVTLAILGEDIVLAALGESWRAAATPFRILCLCGFFITACEIADRVILASGASGSRLRVHLGMVAAMLVGVGVGAQWGVVGAAYGVLAANAYQYLSTSRLALSQVQGNWQGFFAAQATGVIVAAAAGAVTSAVDATVSSVAPGLLATGSALAAAVATSFAIACVLAPRLPEPLASHLGRITPRWLRCGADRVAVWAFGQHHYTVAPHKTCPTPADVRLCPIEPVQSRRSMDSLRARPASHDSRRPIRVLQVFGRMDPGGAEMRTLDVLRALPRDEFQVDFCTTSGGSGTLDDTFRQLGCEILPVPLDWGFARRFVRLLMEGEYDVVHTHSFHTSGYFLRLAARAGTPVRVAHYRSTGDGRRQNLRRRLQRWVGSRLVDRHATHVLAVSNAVMQAAWGNVATRGERFRVVYNGIDPSGWPEADDREGVRAEFGFPPSCRLAINIGNLHAAKNHQRLLRIMSRVADHEGPWRLLLVGHGENEEVATLRRLAAELGIADRLAIAGRRSDIARLLLASDVMVFPSIREGLPGAVLEACATGLPVLASDLPGILEIQPHLPTLRTLSLSVPDLGWAQLVEGMLADRQDPLARARARAAFAHGPFSVRRAADAIAEVWRASSDAPRRHAGKEAA